MPPARPGCRARDGRRARVRRRQDERARASGAARGCSAAYRTATASPPCGRRSGSGGRRPRSGLSRRDWVRCRFRRHSSDGQRRRGRHAGTRWRPVARTGPQSGRAPPWPWRSSRFRQGRRRAARTPTAASAIPPSGLDRATPAPARPAARRRPRRCRPAYPRGGRSRPARAGPAWRHGRRVTRVQECGPHHRSQPPIWPSSRRRRRSPSPGTPPCPACRVRSGR